MIICSSCGHHFDYYSVGEWCMGVIQCPNLECGCLLDQDGKFLQPKPDRPHSTLVAWKDTKNG